MSGLSSFQSEWRRLWPVAILATCHSYIYANVRQTSNPKSSFTAKDSKELASNRTARDGRMHVPLDS
ncbi:hypothetical protein VNO77_11064 [Canavalia gladiata]|uniref:Uncharacterized protein n=1 Tax=Canavalia gladiata TaxID=3824 RepID=A0AAN9MGK2_CANGL